MKKSKYFVLLGIFLLGVSLVIFVLTNTERRGNLVDYIQKVVFNKSSELIFKSEAKQLTIINNSSLVKIRINDKNKLDQILREYNQSLSNYKDIELTIEDKEQDINFGWGTGTTFGYSISPVPSETLKISLFINLPVINSYQWSNNNIASETEYIFINSLERAVVNTNESLATTKTDQEERLKTENIDENAMNASQSLDTDNSENAFTIEVL